MPSSETEKIKEELVAEFEVVPGSLRGAAEWPQIHGSTGQGRRSWEEGGAGTIHVEWGSSATGWKPSPPVRGPMRQAGEPGPGLLPVPELRRGTEGCKEPAEGQPREERDQEAGS